MRLPPVGERHASETRWPTIAAVFGASGGIGAALCRELARRGCGLIYAAARKEPATTGEGVIPLQFDLTSEDSIRGAAERMAVRPPDLVFVASGVLTLDGGARPERTYRELDGPTMLESFALNAVGPALIARHVLPLLPRDRRAAFAMLSARVGSIGDNRLGGWHSYRASKAALNMLIRNFALELARTHRQAVVVGLHPGTVDTALSAPFQANLPAGQLTAPDMAAGHLLDVVARLRPEDSGGIFDWRGEAIPA